MQLVILALETESERAGYWVGVATAVCILLAGILKTVAVMRRPTTNKICLLALLLVLVGWLGSSALGWLNQPDQVSRALAGVLALLLMGLFFTALVLGIVGLATYDRARHRQGRAQAVWAVCLSVGFCLISLGTAVMRLSSLNEGEKSIAVSKPIRVPDYNFEVKPSSQWLELKPGALNKLSCLAMRKGRSDIYAMVIGEKLQASTSVEALKEVSRTNLAAAAEVLRQTENPATLEDIPFIRMMTVARPVNMAQTVAYEHWVGFHRGFAWQFIFYGSEARRAELSSAAEEVMCTFRLLDKERSADAAVPVQDVNRPALGYRTRLAPLGWGVWEDPDKNALQDFSTLHGNEAIVVVPLRLEEDPPDLEAVARGLLGTMDLTYTPGSELFTTKPWNPGNGGEGLEITTEREVDGTHFSYLARIARSKRLAVMIAGWTPSEGGDMPFVRRGLDAVTLTDAEGPAPEMGAERKKAAGLALNSAALSYTQRKAHEEAARWMMKGFQWSDDPTTLANVAHQLESAGKPQQGLELLKPHVARFPDHPYLNNQHARLQVLCGSADEGNRCFLALLDHGFKDESELLDWLKFLNEHDFQKQAVAAADAWVARLPSKDTRRWQAQVAANAGDKARAILLLEKLRAEFPDDAVVACDLGEYYNDVDDNAKAATLAEKLIAEGKDSTRALTLLGWSQMGRGWFRDAKATFERAAKKAPGNEDVQEAIRSASARLGQGDNSLVKEPLDPVPLPEEAARAIAAVKTPEGFGSGHALVYLLRSKGCEFVTGKPSRTTSTSRVRVLTKQGAKDLSSLRFSFNPLHERLFVNRVEVKDAAGKVKAAASVDDSYLTDAGSDLATEERTLNVQVPGVEPGCVVEWVVTHEDKAPSDTPAFERHLFSYREPVAAQLVFYTGDVGAVRHTAAQAAALQTLHGKRLLGWLAVNQEPVPPETWAIDAERRKPIVWTSGDEGSWEKLGLEYARRLEAKSGKSPKSEALAARLTQGLEKERDKIGAILRQVQRDVSYKGIEFGVRGRQPNPADETLRLRYGDCKDHAVLLHTLLRAAGIHSHLALVNTAWRIQPRLPSMDQFNHMIVVVPTLGPQRCIDATNKTLAAELYPDDGGWNTQVLVLDPAGPRLLDAPGGFASESACEVRSQRVITPEGADWQVRETLTLTGYYAAWMRRAFIDQTARQQLAKAQDILQAQGPAVVESISFDNLEDIAQPARVAIVYRITQAVSEKDGQCVAALPALWERDYLAKQRIKDRATPFRWEYPLRFTSEVEVRLPSAASAGALKQSASGDFCDWKLTADTTGTSLRVRFDFQAQAGEFPAARYQDFQSAWESARRAWEPLISWKR